MACLMTELFAKTATNRSGSMGMTGRFGVYYFYTVAFEDGSLTRPQFESMLAGMMDAPARSQRCSRSVKK